MSIEQAKIMVARGRLHQAALLLLHLQPGAERDQLLLKIKGNFWCPTLIKAAKGTDSEVYRQVLLARAFGHRRVRYSRQGVPPERLKLVDMAMVMPIPKLPS